MAWRYGTRSGQVFRWEDGSKAPGGPRPRQIEVLTARGWLRLGPVLRWFLWRRGKDTTPASAERRRVRAWCPQTLDAEPRPRTPRSLARAFWLTWLLSPPLSWGAPRFLIDDGGPRPDPKLRERAEESFLASLPSGSVDDDLVEQARSGWERARDRQAGFEARAATFIQVAGLTTTVVLINSTLLSGDNKITGDWRMVFLVAMIVASVCLLGAGTYGLYATMRTFGRTGPDDAARVIERAKIADLDARRRVVVAALLVAQRRTSIVADWKLARLKRASIVFGLAVVAIATASVAFVAATS